MQYIFKKRLQKNRVLCIIIKNNGLSLETCCIVIHLGGINLYQIIKGHINQPIGFKAGGMHAGIKKDKKDLAIVYTETPATVACLFTTNVVKAASVLWNQKILTNGNKVNAVVINSGNANACTGEQGKIDNENMAQTAAEKFGCASLGVLTASTGVIGVPLPIEIITKGIQTLVPDITHKEADGINAANAIMTTDTFSKEVCVTVNLSGKVVTISGMAKGSGMIHPNMATMLSFVTTDVAIDQETLQNMLKEINEDTYSMITVDGDTSTNDMVVVLANGMAENEMIKVGSSDYADFKEAMYFVHQTLAKSIVKDGEGASKLIEAKVTGAKSVKDAKMIVKSILGSSLVKTALFGEDANWGRVLCAAGYSGADFDPEKVNLSFASDLGEIQLLKHGEPIAFSEEKASEILSVPEVKILITLNDGESMAIGWGCDLSYEYVKINGEYRS